MRGIAALVVAGVHVSQSPTLLNNKTDALLYRTDSNPNMFSSLLTTIYRIIANGHGTHVTPAVLLFFVLSGFVLSESLERNNYNISGLNLRIFGMARVFRLFPAIWFAVLVYAAIQYTFGYGLFFYGFGAFPYVVENMLLLSIALLGVLWSLQTEVLAMPLVYVTALVHKKLGLRAVFVLATIVALLAFWEPWASALELGGAPPRLRWLFAFVFGMVAFYGGKSVSFDRGHIFWITCTWIGLILFFGTYPAIYWSPSVARFIAVSFDNVAVPSTAGLGTVLGAALFLSGINFGNGHFIHKFLCYPTLRFVGKISFSFYLLHPLSLDVIWHMPVALGRLIEIGVPQAVISMALLVSTVAAVIPLAYFSYRYIELPGINLGRRLALLVSAREAPRRPPHAFFPTDAVPPN